MAAPVEVYSLSVINAAQLINDSVQTKVALLLALCLSEYQSMSQAKDNFCLDDMIFFIDKEGKEVFVGLVSSGSANFNLHKSSRLQRIVIAGREVIALQDAGLNTLARVSISIIYRFANYIQVQFSFRSAYYLPTSARHLVLVAQEALEPMASKITSTIVRTIQDLSPLPTATGAPEPYSGEWVKDRIIESSASATNDEGTTTRSLNIQLLDRIRYPHEVNWYYWSTNAPDYIYDADIDTAPTIKKPKLWENDYRALWNIPEYDPNTLGNASTIGFFARLAASGLTGTMPDGWYADYSIFSAQARRAFRLVDGLVFDYKIQIPRPATTVYLWVTLAPGQNTNTYNILYRASVEGGWHLPFSILRIYIDGVEDGSAAEKRAFDLYTGNSQTTVNESDVDISGQNLHIDLTPDNLSGYFALLNVHQSSDDGTPYIDVGANSRTLLLATAVRIRGIKDNVEKDIPQMYLTKIIRRGAIGTDSYY